MVTLNRVASLLGLRPGELGRSSAFFVYLVLASSIYIMGKTVRDTLFLSRYDMRVLPWMFVGYGVISPMVAAIHGRVADRIRRDRLIVVTSLLSAVSYVGVWWIVTLGATWVYPAFYIWAEVVGSLFLTQFWTYANDFHTSRDARRLFGVIGAGRVLGIVLCGSIISRVARHTGTENLILVIAVLMLAVAGMALAIRRRFAAVGSAPGPGSSRAHPAEQMEEGTLSNRYAQLVAGSIFLTFLVCTLADYQFKVIAKHTYTGDDLAAYFGLLYAVIGGFAFVLQFFFTARILSRFGLLAGLLIMPACLLGSSAALALWPVILVASALKFSDNAFQYSINEASCQLLYFPFPQAVKGQIRALLDGLVKPVAYALAGVILLVAVPALSVPGLTSLTVPLTVLWILLTTALLREYVVALSRTLKDPRLRHGHQGELSGAGDMVTRDSLTDLATGADEETALFAVEQLRRIAPEDLTRVAGRLLASPHDRVRLVALAVLEEYPDKSHLESIEREMGPSRSGPVRGAAILAACALHAEEALDRLTVIQAETDPAIHEAVLTGALKYCGLEGVLAFGGGLNSLLRSSRESDRILAARVLGRIGVRHFHRQLVPLLQDPSPAVRVVALRAAGSILNPKLIPPLLAALGDEAGGRVAETSLVRHGDVTVPWLDQTLADPASSRNALRAATRVLRRLGTRSALEALFAHIDHADERARRKILRAAAQVHADLGRPPVVAASFVEDRLRFEITRACQLALEKEVVVPALPGHLLLDTLDQDIHRSEHRIFSLLRLRHDPEVMRRVRASLRSGTPVQRANALEVLENSVGSALKRPLVLLLEGFAGGDMAQAARAVPGTRPVTPEAWIEAHLAGGGGWHRAAALDAVGKHGLGRFVPAAHRAIQDPVPLVRETAAWTLARLLGPDSAPDIARLAEDPVEDLREKADFLRVRYLGLPAGNGRTGGMLMLTTLEEALFLRHIQIFEGVPAEDLTVLAERTRETFAATGDAIVTEGETGGSLYLIIQGRVEVLVGETKVAELGPRDVFGEMALLEGSSRAATVRALEPTHMLYLSDDDFHEFIEERPEVALNVIRVLCHRLRSMNQRMAQNPGAHPASNLLP